MFDYDTTRTVSRRSVLTKMGGLLAGATILAGRGAAETTEEGLQVEFRELTEEYIALEVLFPDETFTEDVEFPDDTFLGLADRFVIHEDGEWVSLPEDTEGLANPVEFERVNERGEWPERYVMYFRTRDVDLSAVSDDEFTLGLGVFTERTIPGTEWDYCPGHRDY